MTILAVVSGALAGVLHLGFWVLESFLWRRRAVWRVFGARDQQTADAMAPVFFNQGFYNFFLGVGAIVGAVMVANGESVVLLVFTCLAMAGAAAVLLATSLRMWRGAVVQGTAPLVALAALALAANY